MEAEDEGEAAEREAVRACRGIRAALHTAIEPFLSDPHEDVRESALGAVTALLRAPELAGEATRGLCSALAPGGSRRERASAALALGASGRDTTALLDDPDPAVRVCAALAPGCADDPRATAVLLEALRNPAEADRWFTEPLPRIEGWLRFTLLEAVLDRVDAYEDLAPAALALIPLASDYTVDRDWGPLLVKAFPTGYDPARPLTPAQRDLLRALTANDRCWGNIGNKYMWLRDTGLPEQREAIRALL